MLFLAGLFGLVVLSANSLMTQAGENFAVTVFLKQETTYADARQLYAQLQEASFTRTLVYESKEKAAQQLSADIHENFLEFLGENPLLNALQLRLKAEYASTDSLPAVKRYIYANKAVQEVYLQNGTLDDLTRNIKTLAWIVSALSLLLLLLTILLINNTVRLSLFARRFSIKSMQLVGASPWFIQRPFFWQGVLVGILGSLMALLCLWFTLVFFEREQPGLLALRQNTQIAFLFAGLLLTGVFISGGSTLFAVRKYLRRPIDELY